MELVFDWLEQNTVRPIVFDKAIWNDREEFRDLVEHMLTKDKDERYGWPQIHRHPYVKSIMGKDLDDTTIDYSKLKVVRQPKRKAANS